MEVATLAPGVTEAGANVQPKPAGSPEQVKFTALSNDPDCGVTLTLTVPLPPALRVTEEGLAPRFSVALVLGTPPQVNVNFTGPEI
jgi:hypothetical protein